MAISLVSGSGMSPGDLAALRGTLVALPGSLVALTEALTQQTCER